MSGTSGDCTIVFHTFETMDLAVRIVSITHFWQSYKYFRVFQFPAAILDFPVISMSHIIAGCTVEFFTPENRGGSRWNFVSI